MRIFLIVSLSFLISACSNQYPNQGIEGDTFPSITGESLEQKQVAIPSDFFGKITLLLIGYKQNSQFDIDRWLIALDTTETQVDVYEIPTIQGLFPQMFSTVIDNGMRAGIPKALWKGVITVYSDGDKVQKYTGNKNPNNTRVVLLSNDGTVLYFYDEGFSVKALNDLRAVIIEQVD
jgi:hypothetical protein